MKTNLSVNVNKIAWLRNAREGHRPHVIESCRTIIRAGAQGVTAHPRPDQRHIRPDDIYEIRDLLNTSSIEYNIEGNPAAGPQDNGYPGFLSLIQDARPDQCTLVPDTATQLTSDHGWNLKIKENFENVQSYVTQIHEFGSRVSLFLDPDLDQVELAKNTGADRIELYTGPWAEMALDSGLKHEQTEHKLNEYHVAAKYASSIELEVNAGHDLDLRNLTHFCSRVDVAEVSIGHALIADALEMGLSATVQRYLVALAAAR